MEESNKTIIKHIPDFLEYCEIEKGLADNTQRNYRIYLQRFVSWLQKAGKDQLKPHELTPDDIWAYQLYLSRSQNEKGHSLKKITQNYYLIALRAFLGYFVAKDIVSLLPAKISLPRGFRAEKAVKFLNLDQVERLLMTPDQKTVPGLRDRAILETIISTGFKIRQIINLNKNELEGIPQEALTWIKLYLKSRQDNNKALFINYKARRKSIGDRLTSRSAERIVSYYGKKNGLPFLVTPEILRWARAHALSDKIIKIQKPKTHTVSKIKNYGLMSDVPKIFSKISSTWNTVENIINDEVIWLKNNIPVLPEGYKNNPPFLRYDEAILRKIAILIVSGQVGATEFIAEDAKSLWGSSSRKPDLNRISHHGQEWHKKMMDIIYDYFKAKNNQVAIEPILNHGRADLGIIFKPNKNIYIEVDTVSLFKLWYNLSTMENTTFLIIPSENKIIEFKA